MLKRYLLVATLIVAGIGGESVRAGYLDENPDEVFADVYARLGVTLAHRVARDPYVWLRLEELKREPCDQRTVNDLALFLEKLGYRRAVAESLYNFVRRCGAPVKALHRSVDTFPKLTDYPKAVEVADEFIRREPSNHDAHYLRARGLEGAGDFARARRLCQRDRTVRLRQEEISSRVFFSMANAYAALGRFCEAATPILTWVALDPVDRDNSSSQKLVTDYE